MTVMPTTETLRAYRYALDPTPAQVVILERYATAARCGFNFALATWWPSTRSGLAAGTR